MEEKKLRPIHYPHHPHKHYRESDFHHLLKKLVGRQVQVKTKCCDVGGVLKSVHHDYIAVKEHRHHHHVSYIRMKSICVVTPKVDP
mgnify:CR=1 FL=1